METTFADFLHLKPGQKPNLHHLVLEALVDGDQLTTLTALQKFRTLELRKIISDLRAVGVPVGDRWAVNPATRKRFKVYFLAA